MSASENLSYQGELPAVSYQRSAAAGADAKVSEPAVSGQVSDEGAGIRQRRRRGIHAVSTESRACR